MYLTHTFAHRETLSRAHSWLTQVGFHPRQIAAESGGLHRIVIVDEPHRLAAAKMLINAAEHADPDGFPSLWDKAPQPQGTANSFHEGSPAELTKPHSSVIGWHPLD
ncbi:MAG: hypothetical protein ACLQGP_22680 [Isosphaeraceae bacterium]